MALGGLIAPFIGIKLIDLLLAALRLVGIQGNRPMDRKGTHEEATSLNLSTELANKAPRLSCWRVPDGGELLIGRRTWGKRSSPCYIWRPSFGVPAVGASSRECALR